MGTGSMNTHTVKVFDDEIDRLRGLISQMGGLAEDAIANAMKALQRNDVAPNSIRLPRWKKAVRWLTRAACCMLCVTMTIA